MLRKMGYTIVLNIGDQLSDMESRPNQADCLLPNNMYTVY